MRTVSRLFLLLVCLALGTYTFAQGAKTAPSAQQDKEFQGTLTKVDTDAKTITARDADNKEMMFRYTEQTEIVGSERTVQGLAGKPGSKLNITYKIERGANSAMRIEILP